MKSTGLRAASALISAAPMLSWASALLELEAYEPFTAPADVFGALAEEHPGTTGQHVETLWSNVTVDIDEQNRVTLTDHQVFAVRTPEGLEEAQQVTAGYRPGVHEPPVIRARVYTRGVFHEVGPSEVTETARPEVLLENFSDQRVLRAALPSVGVGSIVEQSVALRQHTAPFDAGASVYLPLTAPSRSGRSTVLVESPPGTAIDVVGTPRTVHVQEVEADPGRRKFVVTPAGEYLNEYRSTEPETFRVPTLMVSTAGSWNQVASRYHEMISPVTRSMDGPQVQQLLGEVGGTAAEKVSRALEYINANIRYLSIDLGQTGLQPDPLDEILSRRYGDCKDQATLLVAMLAAMGVEARVAALSTSTPVSPDHPGMVGFDHAIVYVPDEDLWIDPTAPHASVHRLPLADQNRYALLVDPSTERLTRTPVAAPEQNQLTRQVEITYADTGPATIVERRSITGNFLDQGAHRNDTARDAIRQSFREHAENWQGELTYTDFITADDRLDMTFHVENSRRFATELGGIRLTIDASGVLDLMPVELSPEFGEVYRQLNAGRTMVPYEELDLREIYVPFPHRSIYVERHRAPPGFEWQLATGELTIQSPLATYALDISVDGGELVVRATVEAGGHAPDEAVDRSRRAYRRFRDVTRQQASLWSIPWTLEDQGLELEALATHRQLVSSYPQNPHHAIRMSRLLEEVGLTVPARTLLASYAAAHPDHAYLHVTRGRFWQMSDYSIKPFGVGTDNRKALEHFRIAYDSDPASSEAAQLLGRHILERFMVEPDQEELWQQAIAAATRYRDLAEEEGKQEGSALLADVLFAAGRPADVLPLAERADHLADAPSVVAAEALINGSERAASRAGSGYNKQQVLLDAARMLAEVDEHDAALALLATAQDSMGQRQAQQIIRLAAGRDICAADQPEHLRSFFSHLHDYVLSGSAEDLPRLSRTYPVDRTATRRFLDQDRYQGVVRYRKLLLDSVRCVSSYRVDAAGPFARLTMQRLDHLTESYFARAEDGSLDLLAINPDLEFHGRMIRLSLDQGDRESASAWARWSSAILQLNDADWAKFEFPDRELTDTELEFFVSFMLLAATGLQYVPGDAAPVHLGAGLEQVPEFMDPVPLKPILSRMRYYAAPADEREGLVQDQLARAEQRAEDWGLLFRHYYQTGDAAAFARTLHKYEEVFGDAAPGVEAREQTLLLLSGEYEALVERLSRRLESGDATPREINNFVWPLLVRRKQVQPALELATRAELGSSDVAAHVNTYAALAAANGDLKKAYAMVLRGKDRPLGHILPADEAVIALIAHRAGYPEYGHEIIDELLAESPSLELTILRDVWFGGG